MSENLRFALYGIILVIGVATMVYGVYSSIRTFAGMNKWVIWYRDDKIIEFSGYI